MSEATRDQIRDLRSRVEIEAFAGRPPVTVDLRRGRAVRLVAGDRDRHRGLHRPGRGQPDRRRAAADPGPLRLQRHLGRRHPDRGLGGRRACCCCPPAGLPTAPAVGDLGGRAGLGRRARSRAAWRHGFLMFFIIRIVIGGAGPALQPAGLLPARRLLPGASRAKAYGFERAGYYMGLPAGVILGGAIAEAFDWRIGLLRRRGPGPARRRPGADRQGPDPGPQRPPRARPAATPRPGTIVMDDHGRSAPRPADLLRHPTLRGVTVRLSPCCRWASRPLLLDPDLPGARRRRQGHPAAAPSGGVGGTGIVIGIVLG